MAKLPRVLWRVFKYIGIILIGTFVVLYLLICITLYFKQTDLIYPRKDAGVDLPLKEALAQSASLGLKPYYAKSGVLLGYVSPHFEDAARGTIVVFHGNGSWAGQRTCYVDALTQRGYRVLLYEYPGYGGRDGLPSEKQIVPEAQQLLRDLAPLGPIYLFAESIGTGVAGAVAADPHSPVQGLVLITPFDSLVHEAWHEFPYIPVPLLIHDQYDSFTHLGNFFHPVVIIRSGKDELIPPAFTFRLFDHLPGPKKMIVQANSGHADWPSQANLVWWDEALNFIIASSTAASAVVPEAATTPPVPAR